MAAQVQQKTEVKKDTPSVQKNENGETVNNFAGGNRGNMRGGFRGGRSLRGGGRGGLDGMNKSLNSDDGSEHSDRAHPSRGGFRGRGRGRGRDGKFMPPDRVTEKLKNLLGPQIDLPPRDDIERKFSNHCRLWIGNLPLDINDGDVKDMFKPFGEFDEVYFDKSKGFAFIRMDFKANAEKAKQELHLKEYRGRQLKIRFSNPGTTLKVRNLSPWVTNELLEKAFAVFGDVEKAVVITDDRGKTTGDGVVEFCKKPCALAALRKCSEGCFFLTTSPRPVIVESMPVVDDNDGMCEVNINKRNPEYLKERQCGPRFATPGSFEFEYGLKWKQLYELFDKKKEMLDRELLDEKKKIEEEIEYAKYQHETEMLREELRQREEMNQRQKDDYEMRQKEWDEHRRIEDDRSRRIESELSMKFRQQDEELRRRQEENRIFMQERQVELMKAENHDGFVGDFVEGGGNWRRNPEGGYQMQGGGSWRGGGGVENFGGRGGGRGGGGGGGSWADGAWDPNADAWQNEARVYGRTEGDMAPPAEPQRFVESYVGGSGGGAKRGSKFDLAGRLSRDNSRSRWGRGGDREEYGPSKRARF